MTPGSYLFVPGNQPERFVKAWASGVTDSWHACNSTGAVQTDGKMLDKPVVRCAPRILDLAALRP